jgi:hypothetical protein
MINHTFNQLVVGVSVLAAFSAGIGACESPDQNSGNYGKVHDQVYHDGFNERGTVVTSIEHNRIGFKNLQLGVCALQGVTASFSQKNNQIEDIRDYRMPTRAIISIAGRNASSQFLLQGPLIFRDAKQFEKESGLVSCGADER